MNILPLELKKNGYFYKQIARTDKKAIYEQRTEQGTLISYEIFKIKVYADFILGGRIVPAHEKFPSDNDFGVLAYTVGRNLDYAMKRYDELQTEKELEAG